MFRIRQVTVAVLSSLVFSGLAHAQSQEDELSAAGFNKVRIEQEDKLTVPLDKGDEVWEYLLQRLVNDTAYLHSLNPLFTSRWSLEEFWDTYYDTPSLQLYARNSGVRHRRRTVLSNPEDAKNGRELMQIKLNDIADNPLMRAEIKYSIEHLTQFNEPEDRHPMLGIVQRSHRREFKERLVGLGLDPYAMRAILTVHDMRSRIYLSVNGKSFMSVSFDRADAEMWWAKHNFIEIEPELNEIGFTEASPEMRAQMEQVLHAVVTDIRTRFPYITQDLTPKYGKAFNALSDQIPGLRALVRFSLQGKSGVIGISVVGVLLLGGLGFGIVKLMRRGGSDGGHRLEVASPAR